MKKEYYIFLVLIVAAAVITGSTIGLASNFDLLIRDKLIPVQQVQAEKSQSELLTKEQSSVEQVQIASVELAAENNIDTRATITPITPSRGVSEPAPYFDNDVEINPHDQEQILGLLVALGVISPLNYDKFLEEFQTLHELNPSGHLDASTLNLIIEQFRTGRANHTPQ